MPGQGVEKYFLHTKNQVAAHWKDLALCLEFTGPDMEDINTKYQDDKSRCLELLQQWHTRKGKGATIHALMEALFEADLQRVLDHLQEKFPELTELMQVELLSAAGKGDKEKVVRLLHQSLDLNCVDMKHNGEMPIHKAAGGGHVSVAELLLDKGAQVNSRDKCYKNTPLQYAAEQGRVDVAELLLKRGAHVDGKDKWGKTPLNWAAQNGHVDVAELLLKAGAQMDSRDEPRVAPLHSAAFGGQVKVAELLLKAGAQVDSRDPDEATPLHSATSGGRFGVAELLLKNGAQVNSRNKFGKTPEDIATSEDVPHYYCYSEDRVRGERKKILELFAGR